MEDQMKYTLINGTNDGRYELLCYAGGSCTLEQIFDTEAAAIAYGQRWLKGDFDDKWI
jgi:hypothetical protein